MSKYEKSHFNSYQHDLIAVSCIFPLLMFTVLSRVLPIQLKKPNMSKKSPKSGINEQNREMTAFLKHIIVMFVITCSYTLIKPQQRGN